MPRRAKRYFRGSLLAVCTLLGERRLGAGAPIGARLLRARALLRLQRPADVVDELPADDVAAIVNVDERATAAMLLGAAVARLDTDRGIAMLADVAGGRCSRSRPSCGGRRDLPLPRDRVVERRRAG